MWSRIVPPRVAGRLPEVVPVARSLTGLDEVLVAFAALRRVSGPPASPGRDRVLAGVLDDVLASMSPPLEPPDVHIAPAGGRRLRDVEQR